MPLSSSTPRLEVEQVGVAAFVRFAGGDLLDEGVARAVCDRLLALVEEGCRRLVLDLGNVWQINSVMVGKLIALHKKLQTEGGKLALCRLRPLVRGVLAVLKVDRFLNIYADEQEALQSMQQ